MNTGCQRSILTISVQYKKWNRWKKTDVSIFIMLLWKKKKKVNFILQWNSFKFYEYQDLTNFILLFSCFVLRSSFQSQWQWMHRTKHSELNSLFIQIELYKSKHVFRIHYNRSFSSKPRMQKKKKNAQKLEMCKRKEIDSSNTKSK